MRMLIPRSVGTDYMESRSRDLSERDDYEYILERVRYYNKIDSSFSLDDRNSVMILDFISSFKMYNSRYFFDTYQVVRNFNFNLKFAFLFGDIIDVPKLPTVVKSRPINGDNKNSIILKLNKLRHFIFLKDSIPYAKKLDKAIFLSYAYGRQNRLDFLEMYCNKSDLVECGDVQKHPTINPAFYREKISILDHLKYKFILSLEGYDVATNLKWIMSSNSIAVMPKPKYETWFMEGTLIPNYHYIEIKEDFSDLEERLTYYINNPDKAEEIVKNANDYVAQFKDDKREGIISHLVMKSYFDCCQRGENANPVFKDALLGERRRARVADGGDTY
ncbi:MAG: glycosyl transferase family 90 [Rikenellaceae bacterium]